MNDNILTGVTNRIPDWFFDLIALEGMPVENTPCDCHEDDVCFCYLLDEEGPLLVGDCWVNGNDGEWEVDPSQGTYAAIYHEGTLQIVHSDTVVKVRAMCSPCYPNQADLDSGEGDILAYGLPFGD